MDLKMIFTVCRRQNAAKIAEAIEKKGGHSTVLLVAEGTLKEDIGALIGVEKLSDDKRLILSVATADKVDGVFACLSKKFRFSIHGNGIAFSVPLDETVGPATYYLLSGGKRI